MGRAPRTDLVDYCYHVINRANARLPLFFDETDYKVFEEILGEACEKYDMRLLAYCIMPNHFHLVVQPKQSGDLQRFMQWLTLTHTQRWHQKQKSVGTGHLYQGRYKSFIIEQDNHLLSVIRYVERNPLRAKLVKKAENWEYSSLSRRLSSDPTRKKLLSSWPIALPKNYLEFVNTPITIQELEDIRRSNKRGTPYGSDQWVVNQIQSHGLQTTARVAHRPKKGT